MFDQVGVMKMGLGLLATGANFAAGLVKANRMEAAAEEESRRMRLAMGQEVGAAQAAAGASGVEGTSSSLTSYLQAMRAEYQRQIDWAEKQSTDAINDQRLETYIQGFQGFADSVLSAYGGGGGGGQAFSMGGGDAGGGGGGLFGSDNLTYRGDSATGGFMLTD